MRGYEEIDYNYNGVIISVKMFKVVTLGDLMEFITLNYNLDEKTLRNIVLAENPFIGSIPEVLTEYVREYSIKIKRKKKIDSVLKDVG